MKNVQKKFMQIMFMIVVLIIGAIPISGYNPIAEEPLILEGKYQSENEDIEKNLLAQKKQDEQNAFYLNFGETKSFIKRKNEFIEVQQPFTEEEIGAYRSYHTPLIEIKYIGDAKKLGNQQVCQSFDFNIVWDYFSRFNSNSAAFDVPQTVDNLPGGADCRNVPDGQFVPAYDRCNKCLCQSGKAISCTEKACSTGVQGAAGFGAAAVQVPVQAKLKSMNAVAVQQVQQADESTESQPVTGNVVAASQSTFDVQLDQSVKIILTPKAPVLAIADDETQETVEALQSDAAVAGVATVQVAQQDVLWIQDLHKLAAEIGGQGYILFVQETQNIPALYNILRDQKHVYSLVDFDTFKTLNGIDDAYIQWFNEQYNEARANVARSQVDAYASFLLLQAGDINNAQKHYILAQQYFNEYKKWMTIVQNQINGWKPLQGTNIPTDSVYIASFDPVNVAANSQGYLFVNDGASVTLRAAIESGKDQTATWQFFNNGYPTGQGATKQQGGTINLKKGINFLDITEQYLYKDDTLWNTGSFITVLIVDNGQGNSYYRGQSVYVYLPGQQMTLPSIEPIDPIGADVPPYEVIRDLCVGEDDLGLAVWNYGEEEGRVKVAFNTEYFFQKRNAYGWNRLKNSQNDEEKRDKAEIRTEKSVEQGCYVNGRIIQGGIRFINEQDNKPSFCDPMTGVVKQQKNIGEPAENAQECLTGVQGYDEKAGRGVCKEETVGMLKKILRFFGLL